MTVSSFKTTIHFQGSSKSLTLKLPTRLFKIFFVAKKVVLLGLLLLFLQVGLVYTNQHFLAKAIQKRASLDIKLEEMQGHLDLLSDEVECLFEDGSLVYAKFGLLPTDHNSRELGTGGVIDPSVQLSWVASPTLELAEMLQEKSDQLSNRILMNQESFFSVNNYIQKQQLNWRSIPSVAPTRGRYASAFGSRKHPITGVQRVHKGIDIANVPWTPIYATADGVVSLAHRSSSFGNFVVIDHNNGVETKYGHMNLYVVKPGQFVKRYQTIGYMGNTGLSAGSHLHYEVWLNGRAVNPIQYILPSDYAVE